MATYSYTGYRPKNYSSLAQSLSSIPGYTPSAVSGDAGYDTLASNAWGLRDYTGAKNYQDILALGDQFKTRSSDYRKQLAENLTKQGQQTFQQSNPYILEDLNARGLATSPDALAKAQAEVLGQITTKNQDILTGYDTQSQSEYEQFQQDALTAKMQALQQAADEASQLGNAKLSQAIADQQAELERQQAEQLAKQQQRANLTQSAVGLGGQIGAAYLMRPSAQAPVATGASKALASGVVNKGGGLFGQGGMSGAGAMSRLGSLNTSVGGRTVGGIGGTLLGSNAANKSWFGAKSEKAKARGAKGAMIGATLGSMTPFGALGGVAGGLVGSAIGTLTASKAASKMSSNVKKVVKGLCFIAGTPVKMEDGSEKPIHEISLGDKTKGGTVISLRISVSDNVYNYMEVGVSGTHAVKEDSAWTRVEDSKNGMKISGAAEVFSLVTTGHRIYVKNIEFADEFEHDEYEELTMDQSLEKLNADEKVKLEVV